MSKTSRRTPSAIEVFYSPGSETPSDPAAVVADRQQRLPPLFEAVVSFTRKRLAAELLREPTDDEFHQRWAELLKQLGNGLYAAGMLRAITELKESGGAFEEVFTGSLLWSACQPGCSAAVLAGIWRDKSREEEFRLWLYRHWKKLLPESAPGNQPSAEEARPKRRRERGRPADTDIDPAADRRLVEKWRNSGYRLIDDFARKEGKKAKEVRAAIDRVRHQKPPANRN